MSNIYYEPGKPRRIFKVPLSTSQYVQRVGRCTHCPGQQRYCEQCRQELSPFKTLEEAQAYERTVQAALPPEVPTKPYSRGLEASRQLTR